MGDRTLTVNAGIVGNFNIEVFERGRGEPLVYLHGFAGTEWNDFLDALATDRHVIEPIAEAAHMTRARDVGSDLDALPLEPLHELGHGRPPRSGLPDQLAQSFLLAVDTTVEAHALLAAGRRSIHIRQKAPLRVDRP